VTLQRHCCTAVSIVDWEWVLAPCVSYSQQLVNDPIATDELGDQLKLELELELGKQSTGIERLGDQLKLELELDKQPTGIERMMVVAVDNVLRRIDVTMIRIYGVTDEAVGNATVVSLAKL